MEFLWIAYYETVYHLENAEMTPELRDDLSHFSFACLHDGLQEEHDGRRLSIHFFPPRFLECLKMLVCYHCYPCILCIFIL